MEFCEAVNVCLRKKFAEFNGRATRSEYWYFVLFQLFAQIAFFILMAIGAAADSRVLFGVPWVASLLFCLVMILPGLAVTVRRLHDGDKSGWFILVCFIPLVGPFILLYFLMRKGTDGSNRYCDA